MKISKNLEHVLSGLSASFVIGVLALQVISTFLAGLGLSFEGQQFIFGLLILPLVALYSRAPHIREQI